MMQQLKEIENGWLVSNTGYILLGVAIEHTTYFKTLDKAMAHILKQSDKKKQKRTERKLKKRVTKW